MATRMQQRRGTAAQWTSANPILNAGEIGWESDSNKFKIGDGTNHWEDLSYFLDESAMGGSIDDYIPLTQKDAANGVPSLNADANVLTKTGVVFEGTTADSYETTLAVTDPTADRTITLPNASGTVITTGNLSDITDIGVFSSTITMEGSTADAYELTLSAGDPTADRTITFPDATGTVALTSNIPSNTDSLSEGSTNQYFTNERAQDALGNALGSGLSYNDTTGAISVDTTTIQARVADVSDTEIGYLNGVTSAIQTQLDAKSTDSKTETFTNKSISLTTNTLSGTTAEFNTALTDSNFVTTGDTGSVTSTMIADGTIVDADINASAAIAQSKISGLTTDLGNKQDKISGVSDTEIGYLNGVTSAIQTQIDGKLALSGGTMTGAIAMGTSKITGLGTPTADADAATKAYVDAATAGLNVHAAVQAATTANVTLASAVENGDTLDGVTLATGNRILVKNQTDKTENGVYVVAASGAPSRADDYNTAGEVDAGDFIFVEAGTANGKTGWVQTNVITTVGSDNIEFTQFSGAGTYSAGTGLTLTGTTFSINTGTTVDLNTAQTLTNKTLTSPTITGTGSIAGTFTGNLTGNVTGDVSGNAGTVTNGVYTTGSYSNPSWITSLDASKVGLGNVENTTLSTWAGSTNITTLGTITSGTWSGTTIGTTKGGTGLTSYTTGDVIYASASDTLSKLTAGTEGYLLTMVSGVPAWAAAPVSLPSQTGNAGKYLTTDGTTASWGYNTPDATPHPFAMYN